jgi:hypothetical protein
MLVRAKWPFSLLMYPVCRSLSLSVIYVITITIRTRLLLLLI